LATQRITVMKVAGVGGDWIADRLSTWASQRMTDTPDEWGSDQWPETVRQQADHLCGQLRDHPTPPPVIHFVEWIDQWSMGDVFDRWLFLRTGCPRSVVYGDRYWVYWYRLPDDGQLLSHLSKARRLQWQEEDWFVERLREAVKAWDKLVDRSLIVVLREVIDGLATDDEILESLGKMPNWLAEINSPN